MFEQTGCAEDFPNCNSLDDLFLPIFIIIGCIWIMHKILKD